MKTFPNSRNTDVVVQSLGKEVLIYDLITHRAFNLNETSSIVYQACGDGLTLDELKRKHQFTDELIYLALDELKDNNLLENAAYKSPLVNLSRREAIRKIGLASMIALPVISSLVAPTAAMAQSGRAANGTNVGTTTSTGNVCGGGIAQGARTTGCDAAYSGSCTSTNATFVPGSCNFNAGTNQSTYSCQCTA